MTQMGDAGLAVSAGDGTRTGMAIATIPSG